MAKTKTATKEVITPGLKVNYTRNKVFDSGQMQRDELAAYNASLNKPAPVIGKVDSQTVPAPTVPTPPATKPQTLYEQLGVDVQGLFNGLLGDTPEIGSSSTSDIQDLNEMARSQSAQIRAEIQKSAEIERERLLDEGDTRVSGTKAQLGVGVEGAGGLSSAEMGMIQVQLDSTAKNIRDLEAAKSKALAEADMDTYTKLKDNIYKQMDRQDKYEEMKLKRIQTALGSVADIANINNSIASQDLEERKFQDLQQQGIRDDARTLILDLTENVDTDFFDTITEEEQVALTKGDIPFSILPKLTNAKLDQKSAAAKEKLQQTTAQFVINNLGSLQNADPADIESLSSSLGISPLTLRNAVATQASLDVAKLQAEIQRNNPTFVINVPTVGDVTGQAKPSGGGGGGGNSSSNLKRVPVYKTGTNEIVGYQVQDTAGKAPYYEDASFNKITGTPAGQFSFKPVTGSNNDIFKTLMMGNGSSNSTPSSGTIKVRNKATGATGSIDAGKFDASKYDRI